MELVNRLFLVLIALATCEAEEITFKQPAQVMEKAFPIGNGDLRARVKGRTGIEPMAILAKGGKRPATAAVPGNAFCGPAWFHFSLDWLTGGAPVSDYKRVLNLEDGTVVTTFKRGGAGFTWTVFASSADDLIVTHLRTDKPGSLNFKVELPTEHKGKAHVEDRRILILKGDLGGKRAKPFEARAWVYPMESEVTPGAREITVKGEGEALILLAAETDPEKIKTLPDRIKPLGFGVEEHPDIFQVWKGLLDRHVAAHRKSMEGAGEGKARHLSRYLKVAITRPVDGTPLPPEADGPVEPILLPELDPEDLVDPDLLPKKE
jgi:hypothetical protein